MSRVVYVPGGAGAGGSGASCLFVGGWKGRIRWCGTWPRLTDSVKTYTPESTS